jgi:indolepyruvate ferredoxin oxidoreductase
MRASAERTVAIVSTSHVPTGGMVRDVNIHYPKDAPLINIINQRTRCEANVFLDAQALAEHFFGDHLAANMIVVGAAFQKGLLPISADNVERAIKLNGASVDINVKAFRLGRLYVLQPEKMNIESSTKRRSLNIDELVAHRMTDLTMYQSAKYARRYAEYVESVRKIERKILPNSSDITEAVARNLYKLMAYKDEYEVARLYLDPEIKRASIEQFGQSANVHYHLRPPFLSALGMKRKIAFGKWFNGVFQVLANMKTLRGTVFDVFGYAHIRKIERQLIDEYCDLILSALANVSPSTNRHVITLANSPDMIRGYEDVKLKNIDAWRKKVNELKSLIGI